MSRISRIWTVSSVLVLIAGALAMRTPAGMEARERIFGRSTLARSSAARIELELDLREAPRLRGVATLSGVSDSDAADPLEFLLNRDLAVDRVLADDSALEHGDGPRLRSQYHREARAVRVERPARRGPWSVRIEYSGRGLDGSEGRDWMGALLLARDEMRMSVQTVFYPEVDPDPDGPGVAPLPASVRVLAPDGFEVYVPGRKLASEPADGGGTAWRFESEHPTVLSLFAAPRVRTETQLGDATFVTLLRAEHAPLGAEFARVARRILDLYGVLWGAIGTQTLGVCEIEGRGDSYNWASQGIVTLDRYALDGRVPVEKLAHEIAHLWWGQDVVASGPGERFLTESFAEYASWRFLAREQGPEAARRKMDTARARWLDAVHRRGKDPALVDVSFATPDYQALAYSKGPLVLAALENRIGTEAMDALLRAHRDASRTEGTLEGFQDLVRVRVGDPARITPWIRGAGHAHLELADVVVDERGVRGALRIAACESGCPSLAPGTVEIGARWRDRSATVEVAIDGARSAFEAAWSSAPSLVEIDPRGLVLGDRPAALYRGPARLESTDPALRARDVPLGTIVARLRFAAPIGPLPEDAVERIQRASSDAAHEKGSGWLHIASARITDDRRELVIGVDGTFPATEHVLAVPQGFEDADGLPLPEQILTFTTRDADPASRPRLVSSDPATGALDVPVAQATVRVVFSEPMRTRSGFKKPRIRELEGEGWRYPKVKDGRWEDDRTFVLTVSQPLEPGQRYALPFGEQFVDREGLEVLPFDLKFTTAPR